MARTARVKRKTNETDISIEINLDGSGMADIKTPVPFLSHMLANFARHGLFDLKVLAKGDTEVDLHHTVEDIGITLGEAVKKALGEKTGIKRCASSTVPMMDSLSTVVVDISGRPYLQVNATKESRGKKILSVDMKKGGMEEAFDLGLLKEFLKAFSNASGADLHVLIHYGADLHHSIESIFKAFGRALAGAVEKDKRIKGVLSTKGLL
ncbi:MAG: imidazoleglycerol-phosphate dehydratase HisB [Deltaproteobacteria bacterium]